MGTDDTITDGGVYSVSVGATESTKDGSANLTINMSLISKQMNLRTPEPMTRLSQ